MGQKVYFTIDDGNREPLTREQAIEMGQSGWWEESTPNEIVSFQLYEPLMCMDFGAFHEAVEKVLGRPVFTHEFAFIDLLRKEYEGKRASPTFSEIVSLIPEDKLLIVAVDDGAAT